MSMFRKLPILLAAMALAACTALSAVGTAANVLAGGATPAAIQATGGTVVLDGTKGLILAHLAYQSAGESALAARKAGVVPDSTWSLVKQYDNTAYAYLQKGDAAQDAASRAASAASALQAIDALKSLVPASFFGK